jgi:phage I-like protein
MKPLETKIFKMKIKTCRRESKESSYLLRHAITDGSKEMEDERNYLRQEAKEVVLIFTAILKKRKTVFNLFGSCFL